MLHVVFGLLLHEIVPQGASAGIVVAFLGIAAVLGILFAARAVRVRRERGGGALLRLALSAATLLALACAAGAGSLGGHAAAFLTLWVSLWVPATAGLGAAAVVIHRRAARRAALAPRPAPRYMAILHGETAPSALENVAGEVALAATVFVGVAAATVTVPFVLFFVTLHGA